MNETLYIKLGSTPQAERLAGHIMAAKDEELFHMDVYGLADEWGMDRRSLLEIFLAGVHEGVFELEWEYHCAHCGAVARESLSLRDAHEGDYCAACTMNFSNALDDNIEVLFSIHPGIKTIPAEFKEKYFSAILESVRKTKKYEWKGPRTIKGMDVVNHPLFRRLFEDETLLPDQSLGIRTSAVLFTDIKGSTVMYETLGDSRAFGLVREHFRILFDSIEKNRGVAIKTIGDAVMGVFASEGDSLAASFEAQKELAAFYGRKPPEERIEVKMGIHSGPAIMVTLNGRLDYFGTTVNMAARIQGLANPGEVVFSEAVYEGDESRKTITRYTHRLVKSQVELKGLSGSRVIYRASLV